VINLQPAPLPPLSLYIHIPWCLRKCPYCDFNSHQSDDIPERAYVTALIDDLSGELYGVQGRELQSIFFGGGTPSLFSGGAISDILGAVRQRIRFADDIEITLEANPGTAEQNKFSDYWAAGVNRLSIGVQSFDQRQLEKLGRIHSGNEASAAVGMAQKAGFSNINIDLMHGLPGQQEPQACEDLNRAMALGASHISWYQLTIEPNTAFYSAPPILPSDDFLADIQQAGETLLQQGGYRQYETSAYATAGKQSRHNRNYWLFGDYIGIGAGAHGKLTDAATGAIQRRWKTRQPNHYLDPEKAFCSGVKTLLGAELPLEFMMNALRLNSGFNSDLYRQRTGMDLTDIEPTLASLQQRVLLQRASGIIAPTELGRRFLNELLAAF
jgi:oxygen-independent coproporphyrinogen-3 oxidase